MNQTPDGITNYKHSRKQYKEHRNAKITNKLQRIQKNLTQAANTLLTSLLSNRVSTAAKYNLSVVFTTQERKAAEIQIY